MLLNSMENLLIVVQLQALQATVIKQLEIAESLEKLQETRTRVSYMKNSHPLYPSIVSNLRGSFYPIFILNSFLSNVNVFAFSHLDLNKYVFSFACLVDFFVEHDIINPFLHNLMTELMV